MSRNPRRNRNHAVHLILAHIHQLAQFLGRDFLGALLLNLVQDISLANAVGNVTAVLQVVVVGRRAVSIANILVDDNRGSRFTKVNALAGIASETPLFDIGHLRIDTVIACAFVVRLQLPVASVEGVKCVFHLICALLKTPYIVAVAIEGGGCPQTVG